MNTGKNVTVVDGRFVNVTGSSRDQAARGAGFIVPGEMNSTRLPDWLPGFIKRRLDGSSDAARRLEVEATMASAEQWEVSGKGKIKKSKRPKAAGQGGEAAAEEEDEEEDDDDDDDDADGLNTLDGLLG